MDRTELLDGTTQARICADGSLVADVRAARIGIQTYLRSETDAPADFTGDEVRVYRPEEEVFNRDSMASFAAAPFTIDHPSVPVTAANWRDLGAGEVNGDVVRDGGFVRVPVIVRDAKAVETVRTTHKQLSMGYSCRLDWTPGLTADGEAYDAVQRDIRINHIAAVRSARGGSHLKITDERTAKGENPVPTMMIDGLSVKLDDAAATEAALKKLLGQVATLTAAAEEAEKALGTEKAASAAKDARITELDQAVSDAKVTPEQLRDAAKAYADVCAKAKALGVTVADDADADTIRKAVVDAKLGDKAKDYTADGIAAAFDVLTADAKVEPGKPVNDQYRGVPTGAFNFATLRDAARASAVN